MPQSRICLAVSETRSLSLQLRERLRRGHASVAQLKRLDKDIGILAAATTERRINAANAARGIGAAVDGLESVFTGG